MSDYTDLSDDELAARLADLDARIQSEQRADWLDRKRVARIDEQRSAIRAEIKRRDREPVADLDTTRADFLAWRKFGIGASDVAALFGMSPWASPYSVWADKLGLSADEDSEILEYGRRAEPMLKGYFEDRTGLYVLGEQTRAVHPEHEHHRATLDGEVYDAPFEPALGVVEFKTTSARPWDGEVPDQYAIQVQWQMHVSGHHHAWVGCLHNRQFRVYEVERDQRVIDLAVERVDAFWHDHVLAEVAPPADASEATARAIAAAFPQHIDGASVALDDLRWAFELRADAKERAAAAKADTTKADNAIKAALGDAEIGTLGGEKVATYKTQHRAERVVKATTFRTLRITTKDGDR